VLLEELSRFVKRRRYAPVLVTVMFLLYMPLVGQAIAALECRDQTIGGTTYLASDLTVECWTGGHVAVGIGAVVIGLLMVGVGLPLTVFIALRGKSAPPSMQFMSRGYWPKTQWWESVVLVRKTGLVLTASLLTNAATQSASAILLLVAALWLHARWQPYVLPKFNALESLSLASMITTATVSLIYLQAVGGETVLGIAESQRPTLDTLLDTAVTLVLVGINVLVLLLMAGAVLSGNARIRMVAKTVSRGCRRLPCSMPAGCGGRCCPWLVGGASSSAAARSTSGPAVRAGVLGDPSASTTHTNPMAPAARGAAAGAMAASNDSTDAKGDLSVPQLATSDAGRLAVQSPLRADPALAAQQHADSIKALMTAAAGQERRWRVRMIASSTASRRRLLAGAATVAGAIPLPASTNKAGAKDGAASTS
jgi:hypothetical protein